MLAPCLATTLQQGRLSSSVDVHQLMVLCHLISVRFDRRMLFAHSLRYEFLSKQCSGLILRTQKYDVQLFYSLEQKILLSTVNIVRRGRLSDSGSPTPQSRGNIV